MTDDKDSENTPESTTVESDGGNNVINDASVKHSAKTGGKTSGKAGGKTGSVLLVLLLLIVAAASGAGGFYLWQQQQIMHQQLLDINQQLQGSQKQLQASLNEFQKQQEKILQQSRHQAEKSIQQIETRVHEIVSTDRSDWLLAEVEYLLRLANQHAVLARDADTAEALLVNADNILKGIDDDSLLELRRLVAGELSSLRLRDEQDVNGLYLRIAALSDQIENLAIVEPEKASDLIIDDRTRAEIAEDDFKAQLQQNFFNVLEALGAYIKVQQHEEDIGPLLAPGDQDYLKLNLRFMLEQAQLALMQKQQEVYNQSLNEAKSWVDRYFIVEPRVKQALLKELSVLQAIDISKPLPDISGSLNELKKLLRSRQKQRGE